MPRSTHPMHIKTCLLFKVCVKLLQVFWPHFEYPLFKTSTKGPPTWFRTFLRWHWTRIEWRYFPEWRTRRSAPLSASWLITKRRFRALPSMAAIACVLAAISRRLFILNRVELLIYFGSKVWGRDSFNFFLNVLDLESWLYSVFSLVFCLLRDKNKTGKWHFEALTWYWLLLFIITFIYRTMSLVHELYFFFEVWGSIKGRQYFCSISCPAKQPKLKLCFFPKYTIILLKVC